MLQSSLPTPAEKLWQNTEEGMNMKAFKMKKKGAPVLELELYVQMLVFQEQKLV